MDTGPAADVDRLPVGVAAEAVATHVALPRLRVVEHQRRRPGSVVTFGELVYPGVGIEQ